MRLPGLFAFGLKKNIIYDYLHGNLKELNMNSSFQWYDISDLYDDINYIIDSNIKIINLFTCPIKNNELFKLFVKYDNDCEFNIKETSENS